MHTKEYNLLLIFDHIFACPLSNMNPYFDIHESIWTFMGFKIPLDRVNAFRAAVARVQTGQCTDLITEFLDLRVEVFQNGPRHIIQYNDRDEWGAEGSRLVTFGDCTTQFHFSLASPDDTTQFESRAGHIRPIIIPDYTAQFDSHTGLVRAIVVPIRDSYRDIVPRFRTAVQRWLRRKQQRNAGTQALLKRGVLPPELVSMVVSYV